MIDEISVLLYSIAFLAVVVGLLAWRIRKMEKQIWALNDIINAIHVQMMEEALIKQAEKPKVKAITQRKSRSEEQRLAASLRRKEWWAKKKAGNSTTTSQN